MFIISSTFFFARSTSKNYFYCVVTFTDCLRIGEMVSSTNWISLTTVHPSARITEIFSKLICMHSIWKLLLKWKHRITLAENPDEPGLLPNKDALMNYHVNRIKLNKKKPRSMVILQKPIFLHSSVSQLLRKSKLPSSSHGSAPNIESV